LFVVGCPSSFVGCGSVRHRWSPLFVCCLVCVVWRSPFHSSWVGSDVVMWRGVFVHRGGPPSFVVVVPPSFIVGCPSSFVPVPTARSAPGIHPVSSGLQACWQGLVPSFMVVLLWGGSRFCCWSLVVVPLIRRGGSPFVRWW
jgi:hypothetical protein